MRSGLRRAWRSGVADGRLDCLRRAGDARGAAGRRRRRTTSTASSPPRSVAKPGDVLVFHVVSGAPHSIVFESEGLSPGVRGAINAAMPGRSGELSSPLLTAQRDGLPDGRAAGAAGDLPHFTASPIGRTTCGATLTIK